MMDTALLKQGGIDYEKGVARFLGDHALYEEVLLTYLADNAFSRAEEAYDAKDYKALFACAHELKGTCGNLDITTVYQAACALVELLRDGNYIEAAIISAFASLKAAYMVAQDAIQLAAGINA